MGSGKKVLILGASRYYSRAIESAKKVGFHVITVDREADSDGFRHSDESFVCDIVDKERVLAIAKDKQVDGVVPINDYGVPTAAYVTDSLGLPGISLESAHLATDKEAMRSRWINDGLPCPRVAIAEKLLDFKKAIKEVGLPCILKPAQGIGGASRGVIVVRNEDEIEEAVKFSQTFYENKRTLVESFIEAKSEHSVEVLIKGASVEIVAIGDKIKTDLPYRVDKAVLYPSRITGLELKELKRVVIESVRSLGLDIGAAHVELAHTNNGFVLFELGARCGGGGTPDPIVKYSSGVDEFVEYVRILVGEQSVQVKPIRKKGCCYYFLTPNPGVVSKINGFDKISSSPNVLDAGLFILEGSRINNVTVGGERSGFIISTGSDGLDALQNAKKTEALLSIEYLE